MLCDLYAWLYWYIYIYWFCFVIASFKKMQLNNLYQLVLCIFGKLFNLLAKPSLSFAIDIYNTYIQYVSSTWSADVPCFCYGISGKQSVDILNPPSDLATAGTKQVTPHDQPWRCGWQFYRMHPCITYIQRDPKGYRAFVFHITQTRLALRSLYIVSQETIFFDQHWSTTWAIFPPNNLLQKDPCHPVACTFPRFTCVRHQRPARELLLPMQQVGVVAETWSAFSHAKVGTSNGVSLMFFQVLYIPKSTRKHIPPLKSPLLDPSPTTAWYQPFLAWLASKSATPRVPATLMLPLAPVLEMDYIGSHLQPKVPSFGCVPTGEGIPPFLLDV